MLVFLPILSLLALTRLHMRTRVTPTKPAKHYTSLSDGAWLFRMADGGAGSEHDTTVRLPHGFGEHSAAWFARGLSVSQTLLDSGAFVLDFGAVSAEATVFVNGMEVGRHRGGFSRFRLDGSKYATAPFTVISVLTNNSRGLTDVLPLKADFNLYGGIFRDIGYHIVKRNTPVLNLFSNASPGVKFMQTNAISRYRPDVAEFNTVVSVACLGVMREDSRYFNVKVEVFYPGIGRRVASRNARFSLNFNCTIASSFTIPFSMRKPRLWDGRADPFLYSATVSIIYQQNIVDSYTTNIGVRSYFLDPERGFLLNGREYPLHGVNLHQDWLNLGWAITPRYTLQNFKMMDELNATALRCAHYQHSDYTYSLADKYGIVVWAEIPNLEVSPADPLYYANAVSQLQELISQSYNHPSILFWSLGNELSVTDASSFPMPLVFMLHEAAKLEDPYRLTVMAINTPDLSHSMLSIVDAVAVNLYHGWHDSSPNMTGPDLDRYHHSNNRISLGISEYGAGASINFHSEFPVQRDHTEEYQSLLHEQTWPQLKMRKFLWWKTVFNLADFGNEADSEGEIHGRSDVGLVTYDRGVRKDAFYFYKAVWNSEPMVYITSRRFKKREMQSVDVKVYANGVQTITLTVNGVQMSEMDLREDRVHVWTGVSLLDGGNDIVASSSDGSVVDSVRWMFTSTANEGA
ncbi:hypothetical protein HDU77_000582 [Chytriomyces hyalinus]|nr:hypothetical protein HDU77_000582 [Chytriomyces hyalinus]